MKARLAAVPLSIWIQHAEERLRREHDGATRVLAARMGVSEAKVADWRDQVNSDGVPMFSWPAVTVEDALHEAGVFLWEVFGPGFREEPRPGQHGWCSRCVEEVPATGKGRCLWCDAPIASVDDPALFRVYRGTVCPDCGGKKSVNAWRCRGCEKGRPRRVHPIRSRICPGCGRAKSYRAKRCAECYRASGHHTGMRIAKGNRLRNITPELLEEARQLYETPMSMAAVVTEIFERTEYRTRATAEKALFHAFEARGWPVRPRGTIPKRRAA